jgi:hypothetical protein
MKLAVVPASLLAVLALSAPALADEGARLLGRGQSATLEPLALIGSSTSVCAAGDDCGTTLMEYGVTGILRLGAFELGFVFQDGGEVWGTRHSHLGALGGLAIDPSSWMRLEVLAEAGVHFLDDIGSTLFVEPTVNDDAAFAYVGLRLGWTARFGAGPIRPLVGLWGILQADVGARDEVVTSDVCLFTCSTNPTEYELGGVTAAVAVRAGVELR